MKPPVPPPPFETLMGQSLDKGPAFLRALLKLSAEVDHESRYLHWDKLRHLAPPEGLTSEQWWLGIKFARRKLYRVLPLEDAAGRAFQYAMPDGVQAELHWLDRHAAGSLGGMPPLLETDARRAWLIRSFMDESISSSQLEGAATTREVARDMLRQGRAPRDHGERMIANNHAALQFIHENRHQPLSQALVLELHRILITGTAEREDQAGRFRRPDERVEVVDHARQLVLHRPPPAEQLASRMQSLCDFANAKIDAAYGFLHPVVKAITLHFMLGYDHPFVDGNGRTARALFYWSMARDGYELTEFLAISQVIKESPARYARAFLHTETDDNDLTYFILHQLAVIRTAIAQLRQALQRQTANLADAASRLASRSMLAGQVNYRQLSLLQHALRHPRYVYVIEEHQRSHGISYDVARKDLLFLADKLRLLRRARAGKRYLFVVPDDFTERLAPPA